jgi:hypothetical protein
MAGGSKIATTSTTNVRASLFQDGDGNWILWSKHHKDIEEQTLKYYPKGTNEGIVIDFKVGDRLYLAEQWDEVPVNFGEDVVPILKSENEIWTDEWLSAETMPPEAAQYWYEVTGVRVVQMRDLAHSEIIGAGATKEEIFDGSDGAWERFWGMAKQNWNAAHPEYPWDADRWVVVMQIKEVGNA